MQMGRTLPDTKGCSGNGKSTSLRERNRRGRPLDFLPCRSSAPSRRSGCRFRGHALPPFRADRHRTAAPGAFLAPEIIEAIAAGRQPADLTAHRLIRNIDLPTDWGQIGSSIRTANSPAEKIPIRPRGIRLCPKSPVRFQARRDADYRRLRAEGRDAEHGQTGWLRRQSGANPSPGLISVFCGKIQGNSWFRGRFGSNRARENRVTLPL